MNSNRLESVLFYAQVKNASTSPEGVHVVFCRENFGGGCYINPRGYWLRRLAVLVSGMPVTYHITDNGIDMEFHVPQPNTSTRVFCSSNMVEEITAENYAALEEIDYNSQL
jgi:hypothetical protein